MAHTWAQAYGLDVNEPGDVFSVACALYWHCNDYHEGGSSERYRILSTLAYRPSPTETGPDFETPNSSDADIYDALAKGDITPTDAEAFVREGLASDAWRDKG
jgi:hypothetical protein